MQAATVTEDSTFAATAMPATTPEVLTPTLIHPKPISQEDPPTEEDITIVPPLDDRPSPEPALPVPLLLTLESDQALLHPGEIAYLTLNAWRATEEKIEGLALTVTLPKMLEAVKPETPLRWALPELKNTEIFSQSIAVQLTAGSLLFESAVVTATVQTEATNQFSANGATVLLGLAAAERRPPEEPVTSAPLETEGLVLQGRYGDVTLLIEPGSAERATDFTYTFDYTVGAIHSEVYMLRADNGWGGKVEYTYGVPSITDCYIDHNAGTGVTTTQCAASTWRRQVIGRRVYDGVVATGYSWGGWVHTSFGYGAGLSRTFENEPMEFLGYPTAWSITYAKNSTGTEAKVTEHWFYRNNGYTANADIANNPDPRLGRVDYERVLQPGTSGCATIVGARCQMAATDHVYTALTGGGSSWSATSSYTARPRWVRQDSVVNWADGAATAQVFSYDTAKQSGNQFGNVTKVLERDGSTSGTLLRWSETEYFPNTSAHVVNRPARVRVYDGSNNCKAEMRTTYDGNGGTYNAVPTKGMPSRSQQALTGCSGSTWIGDSDTAWNIQYFTYDAYGNQTRVWSFGNAANGWPDTIIDTTYDGIYRAFPISRKHNGTSLEEKVSYYGVNTALGITDSRAHWGQTAEFCGVNEVCTRYAYDDYGRVNRQWEAVATVDPWSGNTDTNANVIWGYTMYGSGGWTRNVVTEWRAPRCYGNFSRKVYNGLGQLIQLQGPDQDWTTNKDGCNPGSVSNEVDVSYDYDALGNQSRTGVPVATTASIVNRAANWGAGYTATTYDVLGRPKSTAAPNGETTEYKYVGRTSRVVAKGYGSEAGTNRVLKWSETNALGQLYRIRTYNKPFEEGGSSQAEIVFTHDVLGNLTQVSHPGGIGTTTMGYDFGGRKTSMSDPDLGYWSYAYDRQSKLIRQTDARNKTICLYYDGYGRIKGKRFISSGSCPTSGSYNVQYEYDQNQSSGNRSRGQLTAIWSSGIYPKRLYYNAQGQLAQEAVTIPGAPQTYNSYYTYDQYLRPYATHYPDGEVVKVNYNSMGLPSLMCSAYWNSGQNAYWCNGNPWYVSNASYDEAGRLNEMKWPAGGNLWQTRGYFTWTATNTSFPGDGNGRLYYIHTGTTQGSFNRLNLANHYDSYGNLRYYYDNSTYNTFTYDDQNRVTAAYGKNYGYDNVGRMNSYEGSSQTINNSFPLHAIKKSTYAYDANGNLINRYGRVLSWNHENRLESYRYGSVIEESYLYDDQGIRVKKTAGSTNTYYVNQYYEVSGSTITKYYYFNGQRIAMKRGGVLSYLHTDHLGSTVLETNTSGNATADQKYYAYGNQRDAGPVVTDQRFTGQKYDNTGLMYYQSRYYDPTIGAFISPDTVVPDASNVFDYNRYMYARGNALNYNDPTGHDPWWAGTQPGAQHWDTRDYVADYLQKSVYAPQYQSTVTAKAPDAYSLYIPGPSGSGLVNPVGGVEFLRNNHTGTITLFGVAGAEVAGGTSTTVAMFNAVYNLREDNMNYRGPFISISGGYAQIGGASAGVAYSPTRGQGWFRYLQPDRNGSWSVGLGPAVGMGPNGSAGHIEYIPLLSVSPDGTGQYHAGWSLFEDQQHGFINDALEFGMNALFQKYGIDPYQIDWQDPAQ